MRGAIRVSGECQAVVANRAVEAGSEDIPTKSCRLRLGSLSCQATVTVIEGDVFVDGDCINLT